MMIGDEQDEHSADVTRWLQDVARRRFVAPGNENPESGVDVLAYLESLTGRTLRSRAAVDSYLKELAADEVKRTREAVKHRIRRETLLLGLLLSSYLHYYYWDVRLQIEALPQVKVFVPVMDRDNNGKRRI